MALFLIPTVKREVFFPSGTVPHGFFPWITGGLKSRVNIILKINLANKYFTFTTRIWQNKHHENGCKMLKSFNKKEVKKFPFSRNNPFKRKRQECAWIWLLYCSDFISLHSLHFTIHFAIKKNHFVNVYVFLYLFHTAPAVTSSRSGLWSSGSSTDCKTTNNHEHTEQLSETLTITEDLTDWLLY